jgi:hypothetical protein
MALLKLCASFVAVGMATTAFTTSHIVHAGYYDRYHRDYHPVPREIEFYRQWEVETHRERMDLSKRNISDSRDYWNWRHKPQAQSQSALRMAFDQTQ